MPKTTEELTEHVSTVAELEKQTSIIHKATTSNLEAGRALKHVRDDQLYKAKYDTFEEYLDHNFGFGKSRASQLIEAAKQFDELLTHAKENDTEELVVPALEGHLRPLGRIKEVGERYAILKELHDKSDGKLTGSMIAEAVNQHMKGTSTKDKIVSAKERLAKAEGIIKELKFCASRGLADYGDLVDQLLEILYDVKQAAAE